MRPDPQQRRNATRSGQIIYIGDVRRRRGPRERTPDRYYLAVIALIGAMSWAAWLTVVMSLAPSKLLSYVAFFAPLACALICTGTLLIYTVQWWRGGFPALGVAGRQATLATAVVVVNLACLSARLWLIAIAAGSIAAAVMIEVALRTRAH